MPGTRSQRAKSAASTKTTNEKSQAAKRGKSVTAVEPSKTAKTKASKETTQKKDAAAAAVSEKGKKKSQVQKTVGKKRTAQQITKPEKKDETEKNERVVEKLMKKNDGKLVAKQVKVEAAPARSQSVAKKVKEETKKAAAAPSRRGKSARNKSVAEIETKQKEPEKIPVAKSGAKKPKTATAKAKAEPKISSRKKPAPKKEANSDSDYDSEDESEEPSEEAEESDFAISANKSSSSDISVESQLDDGSSVDASEPEVSIANSADLEEEQELERRLNGKTVKPPRGRSGAAFRPRTFGASTGGAGGGAAASGMPSIGKSQTENYPMERENNADEDEGVVAEDVPTDPKEWAKYNMRSVVEHQKDGPWWTQTDFVRDEQERRPDDPDYDATTLHIPDTEWHALTGGMKRYWEIKSKNFDKIVFYRYGHWFTVYYQDSHICNKYIDLCIPPRQRQHIVGFHENHLSDNIEVMVNAGYKIALCE